MAIEFQALRHAEKAIAELLQLLPAEEKNRKHAILVQGAPVTCRHDTDREIPFHQEANFIYLTGCHVPLASVLVTYDPSAPSPSVHHQLFIPPADPLVTIWSIPPPSLEYSRSAYQSHAVGPTTSLAGALDALGRDVTLHTFPQTMEYPPLPLAALNLLSPAQQGNPITHETSYLQTALHRARLCKDVSEIALIREANRISSDAHEVLMRELGRFAAQRSGSQGAQNGRLGANGINGKQEDKQRSGKETLREWEVEGEGDVEALFVAACKRQGAEQAYLPICASGTRASTLHYVCNDRLFPSTLLPRQKGDTSFHHNLARGCCGTLIGDHTHKTSPINLHEESFEPQVLLLDAGCEWQGYASDITRTIPVGNGGKFVPKAAQIYDLVLRMQTTCEAMIKPGVHWDLCHVQAHRILIEGFLQLGMFKGTVEDILKDGISAAFMAHGLGHSLGLDVHDSLQYLRAEHKDIPAEVKAVSPKLFTYLRIRQQLQEGMVVTVEPGCYFPPQLMEESGVWTSRYIDQERLKEYVQVGGVRIEDCVLVTATGSENLTTVGRERSWIEGVCSGVV